MDNIKMHELIFAQLNFTFKCGNKPFGLELWLPCKLQVILPDLQPCDNSTPVVAQLVGDMGA